jgi:hypothetical protein
VEATLGATARDPALPVTDRFAFESIALARLRRPSVGAAGSGTPSDDIGGR